MKSERRGMVLTGWLMTLGGSGVVLFWLLYEAANNFTRAPLATTISVLIVLALLALLVPAPLILATRRARRAKAR